MPLKPPGSFGTWHYKGEDFDEFFVDFLYEPYTLFIISIELEARDLKENTEIKMSSELYKLIWVKQGNTGGCLDLERWYKPELLELPKAAKYRNELSTFEYQLLTVNLDRDNTYLKSIDPAQLLAIVPKLEEIVSKHQDNLAFKRNLNVIKQYLQQTSIVTK